MLFAEPRSRFAPMARLAPVAPLPRLLLRGGGDGADRPFGWERGEGCDLEDLKELAAQVSTVDVILFLYMMARVLLYGDMALPDMYGVGAG